MPSDDRPYTALAEIYDHVMAHVDYRAWAKYVAKLIERYGPDDPDILELGCGTGNLTVRLAPQYGRSFRATDGSREMLEVARKKLGAHPSVTLGVVDFRSLETSDRYDIVVLAYDGINYALDLDELKSTLAGVAAALRPGGLFLFDQSTPSNSINNLSYFEDQFEGDGFSYTRTSSYDTATRLHVTSFAIDSHGKISTERHVQRAFTRREMLRTADLTGFEVLASLRAFDFVPADDESERIQWVLKKPRMINPAAG